MKKLITMSIAVLGTCAVGMISPSSGNATPLAKTNQPDTKAVAVKTAKPIRDRIIYIISNNRATGSNIPSVYRVYHGVMTSTSSNSSSTYSDLSPAGSENLGTSLARLDPSISLGGPSHR